jgi:flagellar basal body rod protein FlgG
VVLFSSGVLEVRLGSTHTTPDGIQQETQRPRDVGLVEGVYFTVKMPEGGKAGYVSV